MLKVLIVDDEMLIRKRLRYGFEWEELGFVIAGEAEDGARALEMMMKNEYDLAIVDIAMPGVNGVELAKELRRRQCNTDIIFLTGHSDFQYAKQAITYGVFDYILKPINEDDFITSLLRLKEKKKKQKITDRVMDSKLFSDFFKGKKLYGRLFDQVCRALEKTELRTENPMVIFMFQIKKEEGHLEISEILSIAEKIISQENDVSQAYYMFFDIYQNNVVVIAQIDTSDSEKIKEQYVKDILEIREKYHVVIWYGISAAFSERSKMMEAYEEAFRALNNARIWKKRGCEIVERTCVYIKTNFQNSNLSQVEIAEAMNVTPPYLSSAFKKEKGVSIVQYLTQVRMEKANEYLSSTDMKIREISEKVGFNDEYYFSRIFKKYYGLSPQQVKRQIGK